MSVDKFGRHSNQLKTKGIKGPPGNGFKLDINGNYNIDNKLLCNVQDAVGSKDAVNKDTLDQALTTCLSTKNTKWDARDLSISNVGIPKDAKDAVSMEYLSTQIPEQSLSSWVFKKKRLVAVADPVDSNDVVTKGFMEQKTLGLDKNVWDAQKKSIQNVGTPNNMYDAVNYVTLSRESKSITDKIPKVDKVAWYFNKKKLKDVEDPQNGQDAVTLRYMQMQIPERDSTGYKFGDLPLTNVGDPTNYTNAVNVNYLVRLLSEMIFNLYAPANIKTSPSSKAQWIKTNVMEKYFINPDNSFKNDISQ